MKQATDQLIERLLEARLHDPFRYLGAHRQGQGWVVRAFNPNAAHAGIETPGGGIEPNTSDPGLFEFPNPQAPSRPWRVRFHEDSRSREMVPPETFPPEIFAPDLFLFNP